MFTVSTVILKDIKNFGWALLKINIYVFLFFLMYKPSISTKAYDKGMFLLDEVSQFTVLH